MLKVYVAGPISNSDSLVFLDNIRKGIKICKDMVASEFFAVFCPFLDFMYHMTLNEWDIMTVKKYQLNSLAWLEVSDCIYLLDGWEDSKGVAREIDRANDLGIPIFKSFPLLVEYATRFKEKIPEVRPGKAEVFSFTAKVSERSGEGLDLRQPKIR